MKNSQLVLTFAVLMICSLIGGNAQAETNSVALKPLFAKWPYVSKVVKQEPTKDSKFGCCAKATKDCSKMDCCN